MASCNFSWSRNSSSCNDLETDRDETLPVETTISWRKVGPFVNKNWIPTLRWQFVEFQPSKISSFIEKSETNEPAVTSRFSPSKWHLRQCTCNKQIFRNAAFLFQFHNSTNGLLRWHYSKVVRIVQFGTAILQDFGQLATATWLSSFSCKATCLAFQLLTSLFTPPLCRILVAALLCGGEASSTFLIIELQLCNCLNLHWTPHLQEHRRKPDATLKGLFDPQAKLLNIKKSNTLTVCVHMYCIYICIYIDLKWIIELSHSTWCLSSLFQRFRTVTSSVFKCPASTLRSSPHPVAHVQQWEFKKNC